MYRRALRRPHSDFMYCSKSKASRRTSFKASIRSLDFLPSIPLLRFDDSMSYLVLLEFHLVYFFPWFIIFFHWELLEELDYGIDIISYRIGSAWPFFCRQVLIYSIFTACMNLDRRGLSIWLDRTVADISRMFSSVPPLPWKSSAPIWMLLHLFLEFD